jgi:hypothetical protein
MTSRRKLESNRRNARKSTGPKTQQGKEHASRNGLRHGFFALTVLPGESAQEFKTLLDALVSQWTPVGIMEEFWVHQIACDFWRLKRLDRGEGGLFKELVNNEAEERLEVKAGGEDGNG